MASQRYSARYGKESRPYLPLSAHAGRSWPGLRATSWVMCKAHATCRYPRQCPQLFAQETPADRRQRGGPAPCQRCRAHGLPGASRLARTAAHQCAQCRAIPGRNCGRGQVRVAAVLQPVDGKTGRSCFRCVLDVLMQRKSMRCAPSWVCSTPQASWCPPSPAPYTGGSPHAESWSGHSATWPERLVAW